MGIKNCVLLEDLLTFQTQIDLYIYNCQEFEDSDFPPKGLAKLSSTTGRNGNWYSLLGG